MLKRYEGKFYSLYFCSQCGKTIEPEQARKFDGMCMSCYLSKRW